MIQSSTESQLHTNIGGKLSKKLNELKRIVTEEIGRATLSSQQHQVMGHQQTISARPIQISTCLRSCDHSQQELSQQVPIILEKQRANGSSRKTKKQSFQRNKIQSISEIALPSRQYSSNRLKPVEPFYSIDIPLRERKAESNIQPKVENKPKTKEIQIHIEKNDNEEKNKDCLKKLFKKVNKLSAELNQSQKERSRLKMQLEFIQKHEKRDADVQKTLRDTQNERYNLKLQVATLKELLASQKAKPPQVIQKIVNQIVEVIKQVPVEKIVEVRIEVPKHIPGPERIVQRKVEVPKVIEVQKKVPVEIIKEVIREVPREIIKTVEIPSYVEKPIYIDRIVEKEVRVPFQVQVEVPVFIDRPVFESKLRDTAMEEEIKLLLANISTLESQLSASHYTISEQRVQIDQLYRNIEILRRHNEDKNKEVEALIQNSFEQYNSHEVIRLRGGLLGSPVPSGYYTNNYTISSGSIPQLGARPRFI